MISITEIKIKLKDKEIVLSSEEARLLKKELDILLKDDSANSLKEIKKIYEDSVKKWENPPLKYKEYIPYPYPIYINLPQQPYWKYNEIICSTQNVCSNSNEIKTSTLEINLSN